MKNSMTSAGRLRSMRPVSAIYGHLAFRWIAARMDPHSYAGATGIAAMREPTQLAAQPLRLGLAGKSAHESAT